MIELRMQCIMWLQSQPKTFFADGFRRLVNCYPICIEKRGDYVEI
jgi:hypothetical protein